MLLYSGGNFMQAVEGPHDSVAEVFARITADPRHHGLLHLLDEQVEQRSFPVWTTGYRRVPADDPRLEGFSDFLRDPAAVDPSDEASSPHRLLPTFRSIIR